MVVARAPQPGQEARAGVRARWGRLLQMSRSLSALGRTSQEKEARRNLRQLQPAASQLLEQSPDPDQTCQMIDPLTDARDRRGQGDAGAGAAWGRAAGAGDVASALIFVT